jgi:nicotinamidase-related amidase
VDTGAAPQRARRHESLDEKMQSGGQNEDLASECMSTAVSPTTALIVIDMLNRYEHEDAGMLIASVREIVPQLQGLIGRADERDLPIVYVNDNYGDWSAGRAELCKRALGGPDAELVESVLPPSGAGFVAKARHSIFYETALDYLLRSQGIKRLVLTGQVTEQCVLYSALGAYIRHYEVTVPRDAVAHIHSDLADAALQMMELNMRADIVDADSLLKNSRLCEGAGGGSSKPDGKRTVPVHAPRNV